MFFGRLKCNSGCCLVTTTSAMENFKAEMDKIKCELRFHDAEWMSYLSKLLAEEIASMQPQA